LPRTPETLGQFQLLADEIRAFGGNALLWEANPAIDEQDEMLVQALQRATV
jgi:hypothetical protein